MLLSDGVRSEWLRGFVECTSRPQGTLAEIGRVIRIDARCTVILMTKPFLNCPQRRTRSRHARTERVPQVVELDRPKASSSCGGLESLTNTRWIENTPCYWMREHKVVVFVPPSHFSVLHELLLQPRSKWDSPA